MNARRPKTQRELPINFAPPGSKFNNKSCRLGGAANAASTRIRMASEKDEEGEKVSVEWRRTRY